METLHLLEILVEKYPNDADLGRKVRLLEIELKNAFLYYQRNNVPPICSTTLIKQTIKDLR